LRSPRGSRACAQTSSAPAARSIGSAGRRATSSGAKLSSRIGVAFD
jgi:hypothetical protein